MAESSTAKSSMKGSRDTNQLPVPEPLKRALRHLRHREALPKLLILGETLGERRSAALQTNPATSSVFTSSRDHR